ncbi:MAG: hypothetical protein Q9171_003557 [Xanthocarpia ochracea]
MSTLEQPFRVIVVGAGVAGLTASHCLQKAGIEHVVLERRLEIAPPEGASIAIYPHGARILHQIGRLEAAKKACVPCDRWWCRQPNAKPVMNNGFFHHVKQNHGQDILLLERQEFLQILYDGLQDKSRIRLGQTVKEVRQTVSGVEIELRDGSVEVGDMVLGCDGVHSLVRTAMWDHAGKKTSSLVTAKEKTSMKTEWKCLIGVGPATPGLGERDMTVIHNTGYSFLFLTQPDRVFFFVFIRLDNPFTWPKRERYTNEDAEQLAASVADHAVSPTLVFGEVWKKRYRGTLISIEEGVLDHWHHGRIALAGDCAHKVTPNIALGGNSSMESVVVLCNHLRQMMGHQCGAKPSLATLNKTFAAYQRERQPRVKHIMEYSSLITSVQAWRTPFYKFIGTWVLPLQPDRAVADQLGEIIRGAPKLDFVDVQGFRSGRLPWKDEGPKKGLWTDCQNKNEGWFGKKLALSGQMVSAALAFGVFVFIAQYIRLLARV